MGIAYVEGAFWLEMVNFVTGISMTVIVIVACMEGFSSEITVMVASPLESAFTVPSAYTCITAGVEDV